MKAVAEAAAASPLSYPHPENRPGAAILPEHQRQQRNCVTGPAGLWEAARALRTPSFSSRHFSALPPGDRVLEWGGGDPTQTHPEPFGLQEEQRTKCPCKESARALVPSGREAEKQCEGARAGVRAEDWGNRGMSGPTGP